VAQLDQVPEGVRQRAVAEMADTARAAAAFGVDTVIGFTGSSIWHTVAMFPPVPEAMIEAGYEDFAARWNPILDVFDAEGVRFAHEVHPSEIAYDFWTTHRALQASSRPAAVTSAGRTSSGCSLRRRLQLGELTGLSVCSLVAAPSGVLTIAGRRWRKRVSAVAKASSFDTMFSVRGTGADG
jgi:hypothetical protein